MHEKNMHFCPVERTKKSNCVWKSLFLAFKKTFPVESDILSLKWSKGWGGGVTDLGLISKDELSKKKRVFYSQADCKR